MSSQSKIQVQKQQGEQEQQEQKEQEKQELKKSKARQEVSKPTPIFHFLLFGSKIAAGPPFNVKYQTIQLCQSNI